MKIENGLLFITAQQLSADPRFYKAAAINACVPIRNISHMKEDPHRGKVYTVLHLDNGDEVIVDATIPDMVQLITEANVMNLFGHVQVNYFPSPEIEVKRSELMAFLEQVAKRRQEPPSFAKGGVVAPDERMKNAIV